jgi:Transport and Golgi organisation 2
MMSSAQALTSAPAQPSLRDKMHAMCTVTVVPLEEGFRLRCNRDERRDRPMARPPSTHVVEARRALFPVDPASEGTWIGVNDTGLAIALLNRSRASGPATPEDHVKSRVSRGRIIPPLLACPSLEDALERCAMLDVATFDLFRLMIVQGETVAVVTSDGRALSHEIVSLGRPVMQTSSALGDDLVEAPRRRLFDTMLGEQPPAAWLRGQRQFHRHQWPSRPELSVLMERADARTVSETLIDVRPHAIKLAYRPIAPHGLRIPARVFMRRDNG